MNDTEKPESGQGPSEEPVLSVEEAEQIIEDFKKNRPNYAEHLDILEDTKLMTYKLGAEIAAIHIAQVTMPDFFTVEEHKTKYGDQEKFLALLASGRSLVDAVRMCGDKTRLMMQDIVGNEIVARHRWTEEMWADPHKARPGMDSMEAGIEARFQHEFEQPETDDKVILEEKLPQAKEKALARTQELKDKYGIK